MIDTARKHKGLAATVLSAAFLLGGGVSYAINASTNHADQQAAAIRESAVAACEASLKPGGVRFIIASQITQQLQQGKRVDYHKFFPNIPPGQLHTLIQRQRALQRQEISDLLGVDCNAQYKP